MFKVGDVIRPNQSEKYIYTRAPYMVEGVVTELLTGNSMCDIRIKMTKGTGRASVKVGLTYPVMSQFFELARALTADEAFQQYLNGSINEKQYEDIRRERG